MNGRESGRLGLAVLAIGALSAAPPRAGAQVTAAAATPVPIESSMPAEEAAMRPAPDVDPARVESLVADDLRRMHAATAAELVAGAPPRAFHVSGSFVLEHTSGHAIIVLLGLAPGAPASLPVDTEIEYLRYSVAVHDDGTLALMDRPSRQDLVAGVSEALQHEAAAIEAATAALERARAALPAGRTSWKAALRSATYDARLPRERFAGSPGWSFIFDPWDEKRGGFHQVLLDGGLGVVMVDGRAP